MRSLDELLDMLQRINTDCTVALDELHYLHLGSLSQACIHHLTALRDRVEELERDTRN
jgi:hypothetical protein